MKFAICAITALAFSTPVPANDKEKAKATAAAALALAKAADIDKKPVGAPMLTDLDKAKEKAQAQAKVLVVWVATTPPDATVRAVDAVHVSVKDLPNNGEAKCVVFTCKSGDCDRKASVNTVPSIQLLKSMIDEAKEEPKPTGKITESDEFYVSATLEELPDPEPVKVTKYEKRYVQQCVNGKCQWVAVDVPVEQKVAEAPTPGQIVRGCPDCGTQPVQRRRLFRNR